MNANISQKRCTQMNILVDSIVIKSQCCPHTIAPAKVSPFRVSGSGLTGDVALSQLRSKIIIRFYLISHQLLSVMKKKGD